MLTDYTYWVVQIPYLGPCPLSINLKLSLSSLARFLVSLIWRLNCLFQVWIFRIWFQISINYSLEKYANIIHRRHYQKYHLKDRKLRWLMHLVIQVLPFIDWTCSALWVPERSADWVTAEMTIGLQVDLVLSDVTAANGPLLAESVSVLILCMVMQRCG